MKARKVRNKIKDAKAKAGSSIRVFKYGLNWKSYCEDDCDVGLALNGGDLTVKIWDGGKRCLASARVSVWYKRQYRGSTILSVGKIGGLGPYHLKIDQAAYWALQELGWLYPYTLRYRWEC